MEDNYEEVLIQSRKLYILNFGRKLNDQIINDIKNKYKTSVEELHIKVNINLKKNIYIQVVDIINNVDRGVFKGNKIVINPCGLPFVAMCILVELHARMGIFPLVLELFRDKTEDPLFNEFRLRRIIDLERERQVSRSKIYDNE